MMRTVWGAIVGLLMVFSAASDGQAAKNNILLYPTPMDIHFADAKGVVHTLTITEDVQKIEVGSCMGVDETTARLLAAQRQPALTQMAYLGATCHGAKFPKRVPASAISMPQPDNRPAMIVLFYRDTNGGNHYAVFGDRADAYTLGTCPVVLQKTQAALLKEAAGSHVGQRFTGAECMWRTQSTLFNYKNG